MEQGIRFYMTDGSTQDYDPLNNFEELDDKYKVKVIYTYFIAKDKVVSYEYYPLCEKHGYENSDKFKCNECELEKK